MPESMLRKITSSEAFVPTLVSLLVILFVTCVYFHPLLTGKQLKSSDLILIHGMQKNIFDYRESHDGQDALWSTTMFSGMPATTIHYEPEGNVLLKIQRAIRGVLPLPIPHFVLGMIGFFFLLRVFKVPIGMSLAGALGFGFFSYHIIISEAGHGAKLAALMYCPAVLAAIAYTFRGKLLTGIALVALTMGLELTSNHPQITYYLAIIVIAYGIYEFTRMFREQQLPRYFISLGGMVVAVAIAAMMSAVQLQPVMEYTPFSIRGESELQVEPGDKDKPLAEQKKSTGVDKEYAFNWSNDRDELFTLMMANVKGGSSSSKVGTNSPLYDQIGEQALEYSWPTYWGTQPFTSGPTYAGAIICFLFILGLLLVRSGIKWVLLYTTLLFMVMSLGKNSISLLGVAVLFSLPVIWMLTHKHVKQISGSLYGLILAIVGFFVVIGASSNPEQSYKLTDLFFDYLPYYNKFRAPASILGMVGSTMPWLALLGAYAIFDKSIETKAKKEALFIAAGVAGGICLLAMVMPELLFGNYMNERADAQIPENIRPALFDERARMLSADAFRSLAFILLSAGLLFAWLSDWVKNRRIVGIGLAVLILVDLVVVDTRYLWTENYITDEEFEQNFTIREADLFIQKNFPNQHFRVFPTTRNPFNDSMTPYHLNSIGGYNAAKLKRYQQLIEAHIGNFNQNVINMLNTEFIYLDKEFNTPTLQKMYQTRDGEIIYRNLSNYGSAWIVKDVEVLPTPDAALSRLDSVNSFVTAVIEQKQQKALGNFSRDSVDLTNETIDIVRHDNRELVYKYKSDKPRFVTFSEVYYPKGWTATIDGKAAEILHTNFVLRGLVVPVGQHEIKFNYDSPIVKSSSRISWIGSGLLFALLIGAVVVGFVKAKEEEEEENGQQA